MLYCTSYYPQDEFWNVYPQQDYENLRKKYKADGAFPSIFDKVAKPLPKWKYLAPNLPFLALVSYSIFFLILFVITIAVHDIWR